MKKMVLEVVAKGNVTSEYERYVNDKDSEEENHTSDE